MAPHLAKMLLTLLVVTGPAVPVTPLSASSLSPPPPGTLARMIVSFEHDLGSPTIDRLAAAGVLQAAIFDAIDAAALVAPPEVFQTMATWPDVTRIEADDPVVAANDRARQDTRVNRVRAGAPPLRSGYKGEGVTIAIVDSGIDAVHPDLRDRVALHLNFNPSWFMDDITDGEYSKQLAEVTSGYDGVGHGTHVAGIVGGTGAAATNVDLSGVAPEATLIDLKIGDLETPTLSNPPTELGAFESNVLAAYQWLLDHRLDERFPGGIRITNNSWGVAATEDTVSADDTAVTRIIEKAVSKGVVTVFAAMNEGPGENTVYAGPNSSREVITVANACKTVDSCGAGQIAADSSRGPQVDIAAPGSDIWSALAGTDSAAKAVQGAQPPPAGDPSAAARNRAFYVKRSGTSMAAPHIAGIIALMLEANPDLTPTKVRSFLMKTAADRGPRGFDTAWGAGLVDAFAAVNLAEDARASKRAQRATKMI